MKSILSTLHGALVAFDSRVEREAWEIANPSSVIVARTTAPKEFPNQVHAVIATCDTPADADYVRQTLATHARNARKTYARAAQAQSRLRKAI